MRTPTLMHRRERLAVAKAYVDLSLIMRESVFGAGHLEDGESRQLANIGTHLLVACAVMVGHAERKPMNASKVAHYVRLPRTVVRRSLGSLVKRGVVERLNNHYVIAHERAASQKVPRLPRYVRAIRKASRALNGVADSATRFVDT